jgi:ATP-dependent Lhr-like helicase
VAGAHVVLAGGEPILYLERGGKGLQTLVEPGDPRLALALEALVERVKTGQIKRLGLEKVDGEPAMASPLAPVLEHLGFSRGPRRLTLSA